MPDEHDTVRVVIAAPLAPELCDRIAAVDPRVEVVVDQELLPPMRHAADFSGDPAWSRTPEQQARYDAMLDEAEVLYGIPDVKPAAQGFQVAEDGYLWVAPILPDTTTLGRVFEIFDPEGRYLGRLRLPFAMQSNPAPLLLGDHLVAMTQDELGIPYVVRARIVKPTGDP